MCIWCAIKKFREKKNLVSKGYYELNVKEKKKKELQKYK